MVRFSVKSVGFCVHKFDLVHQNSSQKQWHFNFHNMQYNNMSLVPMGTGKFKWKKVFFLAEKAETPSVKLLKTANFYEKKYKYISMPSKYICNRENDKKKERVETLKHDLCQGFRTGLRRRERSMALFNSYI